MLTLSLLAVSLAGLAQPIDTKKLDDYFETLESNHKFMGSVAVSKNGELVYVKAVGYADIESGQKASAQSRYRIGSISKTFTVTLLFVAIEEGLLNLDQTVDRYFPALKNAGKITIGHLAGHRSGIYSFTNDPAYLTYNTQAKTEAEMLGLIAGGESLFEPDSKAEYSNSNTILLTFILEKTYQKPYGEILAEKITKPIHLNDTYFGGKADLRQNETHSYTFSGEWKKETETDTSIPLGAGGIVSTPADLTRFGDALFGGKLISDSSLTLMKTIKDGYGMGLFMMPFYENAGYGHTGGIDGFRSLFSYFPSDKIALAITANGSNFSLNDIAIILLSELYGKPYEIPSFSSSIVLTTAELDQYLGTYASKQMPLKITVSKQGTTLFAQATGQAAFPLDATGKDIFSFDTAGIVLEFNPAEKTMLLKQGGGQYQFVKE